MIKIREDGLEMVNEQRHKRFGRSRSALWLNVKSKKRIPIDMAHECTPLGCPAGRTPHRVIKKMKFLHRQVISATPSAGSRMAGDIAFGFLRERAVT